jgi:hypothetical protein
MIRTISILLALAAAVAAKPLLGQSARPAPPTASEAEQKAKILDSKAWKQVMAEFQEWLSTQPIYTQSDIQRINSNLTAQIQSMPASELQGYLDDWQAKLKVLGGKNFQEAQEWLGEYLAPCTDGYRRKILKQLGISDPVNMTAAQLDDAITRIRADRMSVMQSQAAFDQSRQQMVRTVQRANAADQSQQASGINYGQGGGFNTFQSPYRPPKWNPPPRPKMPFYVGTNGQVFYGLPF